MKPRHIATLAAVALVGGAAAPATGTPLRRDAAWIVVASDRDGVTRPYSLRPDGSRLSPLLASDKKLVPVAESRDGSTLAYRSSAFELFVSRADGTGLRRLARQSSDPALSRDGRLLAFRVAGPGIWIASTDGRTVRRLTQRDDARPEWSPDGKTLVLVRSIGDFIEAVVVQPLHGPRRVLAWSLSFGAAKWSADGGWIAYTDDDDRLWLVRPDGSRRRRVARDVGAFAWAAVGNRLAYARRAGGVTLLDAGGRPKRLGLTGVQPDTLAWSPDGRRLAFTGGYPSQLWVVGVDGRGLHRATGAGANVLVGWTRIAPVRPPAAPVPATVRVDGANAVATRAEIGDIAADGSRLAFVVSTTSTDCRHVAVWTPSGRSVRRFGFQAPCVEESLREGLGDVAVAGTRTAWVHDSGGNTLQEDVLTATLSHPAAVQVASAFSDDTPSGTFVSGVSGQGTLLAFTVERRCSSDAPGVDACPPGRKDGDVTASTIYRIGGAGPCPFDRRTPGACTPVAKAEGKLSVLSVDRDRIVARTEKGIRLLDSAGRVLRDFAVESDASTLSGNRLAVRTADAVEVYDTDSGVRVARFAAAPSLALEDLEGDLLVTASGTKVTVRRLGDGRTATFQTDGVARAQLESVGLFVAGKHRLSFVPMRDLVRRLGG